MTLVGASIYVGKTISRIATTIERVDFDITRLDGTTTGLGKRLDDSIASVRGEIAELKTGQAVIGTNLGNLQKTVESMKDRKP